MEREPSPALADSIAAAEAWWREAGVDLAYTDEPRSWLASPEPQVPLTSLVARPEPAEIPRIGGDKARWPTNLGAFAGWWLAEPSLDNGATAGRISPRGPSKAELMVLVAMPEIEDSETLLSGPEGRLLAGMVRAFGLAQEAVYFAAALPRHLVMPDWQRLANEGMGDVLLHHIGLAAPKRLLVLGRDILSLLGHDLAQVAPVINELPIQTGKLPLLISYAPGRLLDHPGRRAELWRRWLDWTGTEL